ncbi:hypothetical protein [Paenibacillus sp. BC26]|uniref:hypothetical protein n=1 Tax=Paenibacillus sp. BC26 TaxID=1881032 RepID=UPI0008E4DEC1|nr:hypothetical protein [Paenibacillus sp. BC26]SFS48888.1 hypothetical protein SAMN05428962_0365 [Paenibacillus sp. BC26]
MNIMIWFGLLALLLVSYLDQRKAMTLRMWLMIVALYCLCNFYVNISKVLIPVGFIIGLSYMNKKKHGFLLKALLFGLVTVTANFYLPTLSFHELRVHAKADQYASQFNEVRSITTVTADSEIHELLKKEAERLKTVKLASQIDIKDPHVLFQIWVLTHRNQAMKDLDWLWYEAPQQLHYYWQSSRSDEKTSVETMIFADVGYMGLFHRDHMDGEFKLQAIYEFDRLKNGNPSIP